MAQIARVLEHPVRYFTKDFSRYTQIYNYTVNGESPFFWEDDCLIVYVRAGSGHVLVNQAPYHIGAGYIGILHSYHVFRFESVPEAPLEMQILIHPYPEMVLMDFVPLTTPVNGSSSYLSGAFVPLSEEQKQTANSLFASFQQELDHSDSITPLIRNCLFSQLRYLYISNHQFITLPSQPLCGQILTHIADNSFQDLSISDVAARFELTPAGVNQQLRQVCKENFQGVLNHSRLSNAYSMMLRINISLSMLAKQAGFSNEASFYRIFQDVYKTTPKQYRESVLLHLGGSNRNADDRLLEIESYVLQNFRTDISLKSCSKELYLSTGSINQILLQRYGPQVNFREFLVSTRLRYAEGLLTMSDLPILDIAIHAGFNSVHTFIRLFKQRYSMTPTQYRQEKMPHEQA